MFIISLNYKVPLEEVDKFIKEHIVYLEEQYQLGYFQASGRKVPRTGGVILSQIKDRVVLEEILNKDPFHLNDLADYDVTEFIPTKTDEAFRHMKEE